MLMLLAGGGSSAYATDPVFNEIVWPRHNRDTGMLEWELKARTARPTVASNQYQCTELELRTFKLVKEGGREVQKRDFALRADRGTYLHGLEKSSALLAGRVMAELYEAETVKLLADEAEIKWLLDEKTQVRTRTVASPSKVTMESPSRSLSGEGMQIIEQAGGRDGATSLVRLEKNVSMVIRGAEAGAAFPAVPGAAQPPSEGVPQPMTISCLGPFVLDRGRNIMSFHNGVVLTRGAASMRCQKLTLGFQETTEAGATKNKLQSMVAEGSVDLRTGTETLSGDRFEWDPAKSAGKLRGRPARTCAAGTTAAADLVEFNQNTGLTKYTGRAEAWVNLKPK